MTPPVGPLQMPGRPQCSWQGCLIGWKAQAGTPVGRGRQRSLLGKGLLSADEGSGGYIRLAFWSPRARILCSSRLCRPLRPERDKEERQGNERGWEQVAKLQGWCRSFTQVKHKKKPSLLEGNESCVSPMMKIDRNISDCLTSNSKSVSCSVHSRPALAPLVWEMSWESV